jgi:hypothetical protein
MSHGMDRLRLLEPPKQLHLFWGCRLFGIDPNHEAGGEDGVGSRADVDSDRAFSGPRATSLLPPLLDVKPSIDRSFSDVQLPDPHFRGLDWRVSEPPPEDNIGGNKHKRSGGKNGPEGSGCIQLGSVRGSLSIEIGVTTAPTHIYTPKTRQQPGSFTIW